MPGNSVKSLTLFTYFQQRLHDLQCALERRLLRVAAEGCQAGPREEGQEGQKPSTVAGQKPASTAVTITRAGEAEQGQEGLSDSTENERGGQEGQGKVPLTAKKAEPAKEAGILFGGQEANGKPAKQAEPENPIDKTHKEHADKDNPKDEPFPHCKG